jgi:hypothetical protein
MNSLILSFALILTSGAQELHVERATEAEARQVQKVADEFARRMTLTRDAGDLKELFLTNFMRLQIEQENASRPDNSPASLPSTPLSIRADLITLISRQEWERFYFSQLNFRYYFVLLIASRTKGDEVEKGTDDLRRRLFPPEVLKLLRSDPFLREQYTEDDQQRSEIETVEELRSLVTTLEEATAILRRRFLTHPPEQTRIFRENLRQAANKEPGRLMWPDVDVARESRLGFPAGTRFFHRLTADSLFELWLVKTDTGIRVVWARVYPFN